MTNLAAKQLPKLGPPKMGCVPFELPFNTQKRFLRNFGNLLRCDAGSFDDLAEHFARERALEGLESIDVSSLANASWRNPAVVGAVFLGRGKVPSFGCGSRIGTQNGNLVNGNKD